METMVFRSSPWIEDISNLLNVYAGLLYTLRIHTLRISHQIFLRVHNPFLCGDSFLIHPTSGFVKLPKYPKDLARQPPHTYLYSTPHTLLECPCLLKAKRGDFGH